MSSIYKVAELAGVSATTVSRVINNNGYVSKKTKLKVEEAMKALHYTLNQSAHSLLTSNTGLIGFLVPTIDNPIYIEQAKGVSDFLQGKGYSLIISEFGNSIEKVSVIFKRLLGNRVEGIILALHDFSQFNDIDEIIEPAVMNKVPLVMNGYNTSRFDLDKTGFDSVKGAYMATEHLIRLGHTRIALIHGLDSPIAKERYNGYCQALIDNNVPIEQDLVVKGDFQQHSGYLAMQQLLKLSQLPTAVFAMNDLMAIGAILALEEVQMKVPEEMAIVGFDDINSCSLIRPRLTSVVQPKYETGRDLAEMLYSRITGEYTGPGRQIIYTPRLAVRQSTFETRKFPSSTFTMDSKK